MISINFELAIPNHCVLALPQGLCMQFCLVQSSHYVHSCLGLTKVPHSTICIAGIGTLGGVKLTIKYSRAVLILWFWRTKFYEQSNLVISNVLIRNKLVLRNYFLWPIVNLLYKDKEHLALRNNFRVNKKFLITKFDCI